MTTTAPTLQQQIESLIEDRVIREACVRADQLPSSPGNERKTHESTGVAWQTAFFLESLVELSKENNVGLDDAASIACKCLKVFHDSVHAIQQEAGPACKEPGSVKLAKLDEAYPSDVLAHVLNQGFEATLQEFPGLELHRALLQRLIDADEELTQLEQKTRKAQARLDAADKELSRALTLSSLSPRA